MSGIKINVNDEEYKSYKSSVENFTPYNEYVRGMSKNRRNKIKSDLTSFCYCHHLKIEDLMKEEDSEVAKERLNVFNDFLEENGYSVHTVKSRIKIIRGFYKHNGINLPKKREIINKGYRENIKSSESFNYFLKVKTKDEKTIERYLGDLTSYCDFHNMEIDDLIAEADKEEEQRVRLNKRKLKTRLIEFRSYLRSTGYAENHITTRFNNIKTFYRHNGIEIPFIPKDTNQYNRNLRKDEVPTKEHIKRALETTSNLRNKALFLFMCTSGCDSATTRSFTVKEWILGTKEFHGETEDIQRALDKMDGEIEYIPVFPIVRPKRKLDYYTCITPEANQFIVNWLKTRDNLKLDDYVFNMSKKSVENAYETVNDKNKWGKIKDDRQRFFTSHQMRRFHFNVFGIENEKFAYMIEGRSFGATTEAYFARDPNKIRNKYRSFLKELTIYEKYVINTITDEGYDELSKELDERNQLIEKILNENAKLKQQTDQIAKDVAKLKSKYSKTDIKKIVTNHFYEHYRDNLIKDADISSNPDSDIVRRCVVINEIAYEEALEDRSNFNEQPDYLDSLIKKAIVTVSFNPEIISKYGEIHNRNVEQYELNAQINNIVMDIILLIGNNPTLWKLVEDEQDELKKEIINYLIKSDYNLGELDIKNKREIAEKVMKDIV